MSHKRKQRAIRVDKKEINQESTDDEEKNQLNFKMIPNLKRLPFLK